MEVGAVDLAGNTAGTIDENICGVSFVGIDGRWFVGGAPRRRSTRRHRGLPGDYWDRHGTSWRTREVTEDEAWQTRWAEALDPAPATQENAMAVLDRFPWARPTETVSSMIVTTPVEIPIRPETR
jgi:hypothetical protein